MRKHIAGRIAAMFAVSVWVVAGISATVSAYPAGPDHGGSSGGGNVCLDVRELAPQIRKEPELFGACAPSVPQTTTITETRQPVTEPVDAPVTSALPWVAVALLGLTALMVTIGRVQRRQPRPAF